MVGSFDPKAWDTPCNPVALDAAALFGTQAADAILASGSTPHKQAGHMDATEPGPTIPAAQPLQAKGRPHMDCHGAKRRLAMTMKGLDFKLRHLRL